MSPNNSSDIVDEAHNMTSTISIPSSVFSPDFRTRFKCVKFVPFSISRGVSLSWINLMRQGFKSAYFSKLETPAAAKEDVTHTSTGSIRKFSGESTCLQTPRLLRRWNKSEWVKRLFRLGFRWL
jgi:hypothetical protein